MIIFGTKMSQVNPDEKVAGEQVTIMGVVTDVLDDATVNAKAYAVLARYCGFENM